MHVSDVEHAGHVRQLGKRYRSMRRAQEYVGKDGKNLQFAFDVLDPVTFADGVKVF